jgi:PKD repeat protein
VTKRRAAMSALLCGLMACLSAVGAADPGAPPASAPKREYYLLLDTSTSMRGERIQRLKEGLVREFLPSLDGETRLHLFTFDEGIQITNRVFTLFTPDDIRRVTEFINGLKADGRSTWAWSSLRQVLETGRREYGTGGETLRFFMYTDGEDNEKNGPRLEDVLATYDLVRTISDDRAGLKIFTLGFALHADALAACNRHGVPVLDVPDAEPIPMPSIVDFTWWPPRPPAGTSVKFLNQSIPKTGRAGSRWVFDDGSQVDGVPEPERIFPKAGTYKVSLSVGADKETKSIVIVAPDEKLTAEFVSIPDNPVAGSVVHFISRSAGPIKKYKWELGRNRVADGERASLLFPDEGEYTNRLTVYGELTEDSTSAKLTVRPAPVPKLKVRLYPESAQVGQPIDFWVDDIPGLSNVVWTSAASASPASANRVQFSFPSPGTNVVSATAMWQGRQLVSSAVVNITPLSRPECRHLVRGSEPFVVGRTIFLQDSSQGHVTNWYWDFDDGTGSSIPHPEKTYAATGDYSVLHVVMGPGGRDEERIAFAHCQSACAEGRLLGANANESMGRRRDASLSR